MTGVMRTRSLRLPAIALVVAQLTSSVPLFAEPGAASPAQAAPVEVPINRGIPEVDPAPATMTLLDRAAARDLFRARVLPEPLVPVGETPPAEDTAALARALKAFHGRADRGSVAALETYLAEFPESPWRPSLLANLASVYRQLGAFGRAMRLWEEAWELTRERVEPEARAIADDAVSQWLEVAVSFGQADLVQKRLEEIEGRDIGGSAATRVMLARETAFLISTYPTQVIASGPEALRVILEEQQGPSEEAHPALAAFRPTAAGTSLAELRPLASAVGLPLRAAKWSGRGDIPVPSVMHWKLGHFSAVVERRGQHYRIVDLALGGTIWVSRATLADETSGYFLVPGDAQPEWGAVSNVESATIIGRSCPPGPPASPPPPVPPGCRQPGMCGYRFEPSSLSLQLIDTPLGYTPPRGPAVNFRLTYQQHEILHPQTFTFANVGPKWSFDWQRYLQEKPQQQVCFTVCVPAHVWTYYAGGREVYQDPNADGTYDPNWRSRAVVVRTSTSPLRYERRLPDGTVEVYGLPDGGPTGEQRVFLTQIVDPQGQSLQVTWDAQFRLVAVTDAIGQVTTLSYEDASNPLRLTKVTDPFGRFATLAYTAAGQLASITDVIGITSSFAYGYGDFVARLTTPYGTTSFRHETNPDDSWWARMLEATDPLGETEHLHVEWETAGMAPTAPGSEVPAGFEQKNTMLDHYNTFYWNKRAWKAAPGDKSQAVVTHWYYKSDFAGVQERMAVPHSIDQPLEGRTWFLYPGQSGSSHSAGWWVEPSRIGRRLDDGTSQISTYTYDGFGNVLSATDPVGRTTSYVYAANGVDLLEVRQANGAQTDLLASFSNYTAQHRPQTVVDAAGQTTTVTYNAAGQPVTVTNAKNETTTYGYDPNGYLTTVTGPVTGATTTYTYDGYGRVRTETTADSYTRTFDYDSFDRVTKVTYPDGTYEAMTYDRLDVATVRDRLGRRTRVYHDALRRVVGVRDPLGRTIQQAWSADGWLERLVDGKGQATRWEHDVQGRVTREVRADDSATSYTYEPVSGRLKTVTDPKNQVKTYGYFADDQLKDVQYTNAQLPTPTVSYTYDSKYPRVASMVDGLGSTAYTYHPTGQLGGGQVASIDGPRLNDTLTYTYDQLGRVVTRALNGVSVTWGFDALGRTESEVNPLGTFSYTYDGATPRLATATYPNGQTSTYSYLPNSGDRRLQTIHHKLSGGATLSKFDYTYDLVGNIRTWQQQADAAAPVVWSYQYDLADQLVAAVKQTTDPTPVTLARYGYVYDSAGNRTTEQIDDAVTGATVDEVNRLVSHQPSGTMKIAGQLNEAATVTINGKAASVDATNKFVGNVPIGTGANVLTLVATDASGNSRTQLWDLTSAGTTKTFTYDANGNLTSDGTRTFEWDAENRLTAVTIGTKRSEFTYDGASRRVRIVEKESGPTVRDANVFWDGTEIIEERLSTGEVNRFFADAESHNGVARYVTRDHLGSVREVTDAAGTVMTRNDYDPYGRTSRVAGTEDSRFGYTGHMVHGPSGLSLAVYRAYDPQLGRWISSDPISLAGGLNVHQYVLSNPVYYVDRDGLSPTVGVWPGIQIGGSIGGVPGMIVGGVIGAIAGWIIGNEIADAIRQEDNTAERPRGLPPEGVVPPVENPSALKPGPASRPSEQKKGGQSLWDEKGGEWRYFPGDRRHPPHWDYNPHDRPNSPWENRPLNPSCPLP